MNVTWKKPELNHERDYYMKRLKLNFQISLHSDLEILWIVVHLSGQACTRAARNFHLVGKKRGRETDDSGLDKVGANMLSPTASISHGLLSPGHSVSVHSAR
jgi:hypothetical protein